VVAGIVKLDDAGLRLSKRTGPARRLGELILRGAPYLMKFLSIAGTVAMFLVGGDILVHGIPGAEALGERLAAVPVPGASFVVPSLWSGLIGLLAGAILLAVVTGVLRLVRGSRKDAGEPPPR
jgi:predicted DNA repair protein MutK